MAIHRLILGLLAAMWLVGCDRAVGTASTHPASPKPALLVVSGDTAGWITPCGCTANQSGGLLRRGSYLESARRGAEVVYADVGGAVTGNAPYQRAKFEAVLRGETEMGLVAHNVGKAEAAFGAEYLRAAEAAGKPLISANATDAAGRPIVKPAVVASAGGRRVALVGVLSPKFATGGVRVTEPRRAVLDYAAANKGKYDALVVLAYLPTEELSALASGLPEADAVIGGPTGQAMEPRMNGPTLLAAATNKGKFLVELAVPTSDGAAWSGRVVEMNPQWADQPAQQANLKQFLAELAARDFDASETGLAAAVPAGAPANYRVAGSESCATCHASDASAWHASHHSHAVATLKPRGFDVDPSCLQCHTTGYGLAGGFQSVGKSGASALASVGCENCHGPSRAHADNPKVHTTFVAADQCMRCHDHENSPTFSYAVYWERIRHGGKPQAATAEQHP